MPTAPAFSPIGNNDQRFHFSPIKPDPSLSAAGGAGASNAIIIPADVPVAGAAINIAARPICIKSIDASYSAAPTGGALTILDGAAIIFQVDITTTAYAKQWDHPLLITAGNTCTVTLAAPGGAIVGKLNIQAFYHE